MSLTDELLQDSVLTEASILRDLEDLASYFGDMEIESRVVPAREETPLPTLVAVMEADDKGRERVVTHSFLPLDREDGEFTKFLQFYSELPIPLGELDRAALLEALCRLNEVMPFGTCLMVEPRPELELPRMAAVRTIQGFPMGQPIDQGVFTEDLFLFDLSCELVTAVLDAMAEGKSLDEAMDLAVE